MPDRDLPAGAGDAITLRLDWHDADDDGYDTAIRAALSAHPRGLPDWAGSSALALTVIAHPPFYHSTEISDLLAAVSAGLDRVCPTLLRVVACTGRLARRTTSPAVILTIARR